MLACAVREYVVQRVGQIAMYQGHILFIPGSCIRISVKECGTRDWINLIVLGQHSSEYCPNTQEERKQISCFRDITEILFNAARK